MDLPLYWNLAFPALWLVRWLTKHGTPLDRYEFMIEGLTSDGEGFVRRFVCVETEAQLRKELVRSRAQALHVGAAYSDRVSLCRNGPQQSKPVPVRQFLTLDIDLTDYPWALPTADVAMADKAWCIAALAITFLCGVLRENFGFDDLLAVYSGRRGVHLHACDRRAFELDNEGRKAVALYLNATFSKKNTKTADASMVHMVKTLRLVKDVQRAFCEVVVWHFDLLGSIEGIAGVIEALGGDCLPGDQDALAMDLVELPTSAMRWERLHRLVVDRIEAEAVVPWRSKKIRDDLLAAQIAYVWPRIDAQVATLGHTSKVPYSPHAKTKRIAVPLDANAPFAFDPERAPSLDQDDLKEQLKQTQQAPHSRKAVVAVGSERGVGGGGCEMPSVDPAEWW